MDALPPSPELLQRVRGALVAQGTSLAKWCKENRVGRQWATAVLLGDRDGPAARELRSRIVAAAAGIGRKAA